ncbi:hypothetical protein ACJJTC_009129 [Scirpophaga incertulas]
MSIKLHFLHSHLDRFPQILEIIVRIKVKDFIKIFGEWKSVIRGAGAAIKTARNSEIGIAASTPSRNPLMKLELPLSQSCSFSPIDFHRQELSFRRRSESLGSAIVVI